MLTQNSRFKSEFPFQGEIIKTSALSKAAQFFIALHFKE